MVIKKFTFFANAIYTLYDIYLGLYKFYISEKFLNNYLFIHIPCPTC